MSLFAQEVRAGLAAAHRRLSSKWFYDATGDRLFQDIMASPEYYLTDCEREIYRRIAPRLLAALGGDDFELVELGAGDGSKTRYLINGFREGGARFTYRPVDISAHAIAALSERVAVSWPDLPYAPLTDDYFGALARLEDGKRRLVLFPGANIGNFSPAEAANFLAHLRSHLRPGDLLLTGFDLKKDPDIIRAAYDDAAGVTAAFNLNLLTRINRELGGNFELDAWRHWPTYDPVTGAARSCLVVTRPQRIRLADGEATYDFAAWDTIDVEISQKYDRAQIEALAAGAGYAHLEHLEDDRGWFSDALWRVA